MKAQVSVDSVIDVKLMEALLIYGGSTHYITRHKVQDGELGPATPLTLDFLEALSKTLGHGSRLEILPENMLAKTSELTVWWTPAQRRRMYFTEEHSGMSGRLYPIPALVWCATRSQLSVRALAESKRPTASTKLYIAPFWNTYASGSVCLGSTILPEGTSTEEITKQWVDNFFTSRFSHPSVTKIVNWHKPYLEFMKSVSAEKVFPAVHLIDAKQNLEQFITGGKR